MNRPYELPFYPVPTVLGIVLNLLLTGVLIWFLVQTDPLALLLSAGWISLGVVAYYGLNRFRTARDVGEEPSESTGVVAGEDD
jgi:amino acid transporter